MSITILHPPAWKPAKGYANGATARGRMVLTGGLIGWNADCQFETDTFLGQVEQTLRNVVAVLAEGGAGPEHLVRLTWYITDKDAYLADPKALGRIYREIIGRHYPPMAVVQVVALIEDRAKVEIEATAIVPD
ncbi:RidA family protein [Rhodobacter calidifons]|jgi:enamine deaminase RidA (YjgF/YER057c/UK114 family)|uniref:RidA family protein n=1 Tax=Rhodobacter calidifons TaxID=2715277 RepID=A0ABX0G3Q4_9RHOB|nr:RidA family protein [Rhodobacter calidifons]NHB75612.1 RidA family protein [Rhodobacter calidifons]